MDNIAQAIVDAFRQLPQKGLAGVLALERVLANLDKQDEQLVVEQTSRPAPPDIIIEKEAA